MSKYIKLEDALEQAKRGTNNYYICKAIESLPTIEVMEYPQVEGITPTLVTTEVSEDCISREYMLEQLRKAKEENGGTFETDSERVRIVIEHAPSVVPSRAEGEWKFKKTFPNDDSEFPMGYLVCSVCGSQHANATPCNYCDNCGAKMKG